MYCPTPRSPGSRLADTGAANGPGTGNPNGLPRAKYGEHRDHRVLAAAARSPKIAGRFVVPGAASETRDASARPEIKMDAAFMGALVRRDYPNNVRDLDAVLWCEITACAGDTLTPTQELLDEVRAEANGVTVTAAQVREALECHG